MSHFTTLKTEINDLDVLEIAVNNLGRRYKRAKGGKKVIVRGWQGNTMEADMAIDYGKYDVGVVREADGTYTLVADWWGIQQETGKSEKEISEEISQEYAYVRVYLLCQQNGYEISRENISRDEEGNLVVVACSYAPPKSKSKKSRR